MAETTTNDDALVRQWLEHLASKDAPQRAHAAAQLGLMGARAASAVSALIRALEDPLPIVRRSACTALAEIGPASRMAVPALIKLLNDPEELIRRRAAMTLGELGTEARQAVGALVQAMKADSPTVRLWAAAALGRIGPTAPAAIPALIDALGDDSIRHRAVAMTSLAQMGGRAVPRLIEALAHPEAEVRDRAARTLDKGGPRPESLPALEQLRDDPDPGVRQTVAGILARF